MLDIGFEYSISQIILIVVSVTHILQLQIWG